MRCRLVLPAWEVTPASAKTAIRTAAVLHALLLLLPPTIREPIAYREPIAGSLC